MKRVVITGAGIVSCLGNELSQVTQALQQGQSGIEYSQEYADYGFRSQVNGSIDTDSLNVSGIDRKLKRFLSDASLYAYISTLKALDMAGLGLNDVADNERVGVIAGSGGASTSDVTKVVDAMRNKGLRGVGAMSIPKTMTSAVSAAIATGLKLRGVSYSISSACATSTHCIGHAMEQIQLGNADVILAGGSESQHWAQSCMFDAMGAMSTHYNETPTTASRPYDKDRDGFVIAGGSGMLVVESLEHAEARNANILAEIVGYSATSDGAEMVAPSGEGATRCMLNTLKKAGLDTVDYINSHGTSTPLGDIVELEAIRSAFSQLSDLPLPAISSTKSMTGHSLGAVGAQEVIYCLLMMKEGFIAPSINIDNLDERAKDFDIVRATRQQELNTILTNSFGFGGTNACLLLKKWC